MVHLFTADVLWKKFISCHKLSMVVVPSTISGQTSSVMDFFFFRVVVVMYCIYLTGSRDSVVRINDLG